MSELVREVGNVSLATQSHYRIKRPFFSFMERTFRVFTGDGQLFMYVQHPIMKMREEFMVYADEAKSQPLLLVKARQAIAINYSFDVTDVQTGEVLGSVEKKGLASLFRDKFIIKDALEQEIGHAQELGAALLRRMFPLLPGKHGVFIGDQQIAQVTQQFRFFTKEFTVDVTPSQLDARFVLAVALLALMADAKREDRR